MTVREVAPRKQVEDTTAELEQLRERADTARKNVTKAEDEVREMRKNTAGRLPQSNRAADTPFGKGRVRIERIRAPEIVRRPISRR